MYSAMICTPIQSYSDDLFDLLSCFRESNSNVFRLYRLDTAESLDSALYIDKLSFDLLFLYISGKNGFDIQFAQRLKSDFPDMKLIIVSENYDFLTDAFLLKATNYFYLPLNIPICKQAIHALIYCDETFEKNNNILIINHKDSYKRIHYSDIIYAESMSRHIILYLRQENFEINLSMNNLETALCGHGFLRCHKSFIINTLYINHIKGNFANLSSGHTIPLGRKYKKSFISAIKESEEHI
ncbi:MAG: LytTR family transcriptional regulator DNA-binding domain-containing protein [Firmicutes bacterium]|nr:LytTR family transcriptional regulator DNA-binding domain-containing protein [Bacillota bacterium]